MLNPLAILQVAHHEATQSISHLDDDWYFVSDLLCNAARHLHHVRAFVIITHEGRSVSRPQPVAAILNESEDIESAVVQQMDQEYF